MSLTLECRTDVKELQRCKNEKDDCLVVSYV